LIIDAASGIVRRDATVDMVTQLVRSGPTLFLLGTLLLVAGMAIVLSHNVWTGGAATILVTLLGWGTLIKGAMLLLLSPDGVGAWMAAAHYDQLSPVYFAIALVIGLYLAFQGFRRTPDARP
jgi:hypothetical protein